MTIYPLSGASWPAKQQPSSAIEEAHGHGRRREMQFYPSSCRGSPRQWELRKIASFPVLDADDYWSDASLSLPHLASALPPVEEKEWVSMPPRSSRIEEAYRCSHTQVSSHDFAEEPPIKASRCSTFPPPLDSPCLLMREGRYAYLQTVEKACFTFVRSNGRLLVTETPLAVQPRRQLCSQRHNGRLQLQLYEESSSTEVGGGGEEDPIAAEDDPIAAEDNPIVEKATTVGLSLQNSKERAKKLGSPHGLLEEAEEGDAEGVDKVSGKVSLYTKVLKTLECDAFNDSSEAFSPLQLHLKYGRSSGVASFLHKSLTRVRPLNMLSIWQS